MESAMEWKPASLGWRWSPESAAGAKAVGLAGSRVALSKSMTPSRRGVVRIQWLTAWRTASPAGEAYFAPM